MKPKINQKVNQKSEPLLKSMSLNKAIGLKSELTISYDFDKNLFIALVYSKFPYVRRYLD
jgi:hypothetical protein